MEPQPAPLAAQLAAIRTATTSNDSRGMLPAALHALIAAIFARIFGRLEQFLLLWQSGDLPQSEIQPPQSARNTRTSQLAIMRPTRATTPPIRPRQPPAAPSRAHANPNPPCARQIAPPILTRSTPLIPLARPRPARDPPSNP